jgi:DNA polymerase-3 subunit delta
MRSSPLPRSLGGARGGVYYLHGTDELRKVAAARALVELHLDPATRDFNYDLLRGSEVTVETLATVLGTPPMMAEWRVVLLRETQALASSPRARELIAATAESPPPGLALILLSSEPASTARFYKDLKKTARAAEFRPPSPNDLPGWLMSWSQDMFGRELAEDAARALAQSVGGELAILTQELEKLATLVGEGEVITKDVVAAAGTRLPRQDRWQWLDLVGEGRIREALNGLPVLLQQGESGVGLTAALGTHFLRIGLVLEGGGEALAALLPRNQHFIVARCQAQARRWSPEGIRDALDGLLEMDRLLKSQSMSEAHYLELWLLERMVALEPAA